MRGFPELLLRLTLLCLGIAIGTGAVELFLRVSGPPKDVREFRGLHVLRPDRPWLYGLRPGSEGTVNGPSGEIPYRINADGFRDRLYARPKPPGVYRVVVIGDSIAFGYGVEQEQGFTERLEALLAELAPEARVEVLNMGIGGYNPYLEAAFLRDVGITYEPDLVIVQFCINDLNDPTLHFDHHTRERLGAFPDAAYPDPSRRRVAFRAPSGMERLCRKSLVCSRFYEALLARSARKFDLAEERASAVPVEFSIGPEWDWLESLYVEMAAVSAQAGSRFAVLAFPHPGATTSPERAPVQERLAEMGREHGWTTLDPLPAFRQKAAVTRLFIDWWHPTPVAHEIAARSVLEQLACAGLLPPEAKRLCPPQDR